MFDVVRRKGPLPIPAPLHHDRDVAVARQLPQAGLSHRRLVSNFLFQVNSFISQLFFFIKTAFSWMGVCCAEEKTVTTEKPKVSEIETSISDDEDFFEGSGLY